MEFGSSVIYVPELEEIEDIFIEEIEDGIASCAQEQAKMYSTDWHWTLIHPSVGLQKQNKLKRLLLVWRMLPSSSNWPN
jgi:hypothetical protein